MFPFMTNGGWLGHVIKDMKVRTHKTVSGTKYYSDWS